MSPVRIIGDACVRGCGRPARELGGHCTRCWLALTTAERAHLKWLEEVDRGARAAAAAREVRELDALMALDLDETTPEPASAAEQLAIARSTLVGVAAYAARVLVETDGMWPPAARAAECRRALEHIEAECRRAHEAVTTTEGDDRA